MVASTEEVLAVAVSMVVGSAEEASAVAVSTAVVVSVGLVSAVALSAAVAFVAAVLVGATSAITDSLMMSSSAASAFPGGGAGAIRTDITVTTITRMIPMDTVDIHTAIMDTAGTHTATTDTVDTVTMVGPVMDIAMATDQGTSGVRAVGDKSGYGSLKSPTF